jgi:hypothetical protein
MNAGGIDAGLVDEEPVHADPPNSASPFLPCLTISLTFRHHLS